MLVTAAATEELFFRGLLIGVMGRSGCPGPVAFTLSVLLFVAYHVPYAWLNPAWASYGNFGSAVQAAIGNALFLGILFSTVFVASRGRLLGPVLAHALTNMVPGALYLRHLGG